MITIRKETLEDFEPEVSAYHEAGHAVVARYLDYYFDYVEIGFNEEKGRLPSERVCFRFLCCPVY